MEPLTFQQAAVVWVEDGASPGNIPLQIANQLKSSAVWRFDDTPGLVLKDGKMSPGFFDDEDFFVSGYFVIDTPFDRCQPILQTAPKLPPSALGQYNALTVSRAASQDFTIAMVWTTIGPHTTPLDDVLTIIKLYNEWANKLVQQEVLVSSHRLDLYDNLVHTPLGTTEAPYASSSRDLKALIPFTSDASAITDVLKRHGRSDIRVVVQNVNPLCGHLVDPFKVVHAT